jgi:hypothetical protein
MRIAQLLGSRGPAFPVTARPRPRTAHLRPDGEDPRCNLKTRPADAEVPHG